ncbi:hypothetical protein C4571_02070 [Candidatus Parcubacteria bacterium]|nr:MAG: hypothetical protein C4571_02070 [Candidatus Parcubacteria bacterium]
MTEKKLIMTIAKAEQIEAAAEVGAAVSPGYLEVARSVLDARDEACITMNYDCVHCTYYQQCKEAAE